VMNVDNDVEMAAGRLIRSTGNGTMQMSIATKNPPRQIPQKTGGKPNPSVPRNMMVNTQITLGSTLIE
jgi:hypothetical protein